jgi:hypothetical protein
MSTPKKDRVRCNTAEHVNKKIDQKTISNINSYATKSPGEIESRIIELHKEWDVERWLEMNASMLSFIFVMLGFFLHRYWLFVPMAILPLLFLHAIQGWCPPIPILRRLNVRTQKEIDTEIMALKIIRGDFGALTAAKANVDEIFQKLRQ